LSAVSLASKALSRGIAFLTSRQGEDGLWRDFLTPAGEASLWPTGFIGGALHEAGVEVTSSTLQRAAGALLFHQDTAGGWGYNEDVPHDADSTACALLFLARMDCPKEAKERAIACLLTHQRPQTGGIATFRESGPIRNYMGVGRWMGFGGWCHPHTEVTALAIRALVASGWGGGETELSSAWDYIRQRQRADGSWTSYWWPSPHYTVLQAATCAQLLGDEQGALLAGNWALRTQSSEGTWGMPAVPISAFASALGLSMLAKARVAPAPIESAARQLVAMQDADGSWPNDPILRIPLPSVIDPEKRHIWLLGSRGIGIVVADQHRTFTSAACVAALAGALSLLG